MLCWGSTRNGQLGLGGIEEEIIFSPTPNKFFEKKARLKQIACGYNHTLFLLEDGTVYSCGNNDYEQLGHEGPRKRPEQILALETQIIKTIGAGHSFSLALNNKGQLFCWGAVGGTAENDLFFSKPTHVKTIGDSPIIQIACGYYHFLMLTEDGKVYVCGLNDYGQLGLGNKSPTSTPIYLKSIQGIPIEQIACGAHHSLILTVSGNIFSFGRNDCGQLGFGDTVNRLFPMNLKSINNLKPCYISCGENFTAVLTTDGGVFTFGAGMYGQLGHNNFSHEYLPKKIVDLMGSEITQIACGRCHMIVYSSSSNKIYTYGLAGSGQLGNGTNLNKSSPCVVNLNFANPKNPSQTSECKNYLYSICAGGDQTFLITTPITDNISPLDFRKILEKSHILTVNMVEEFENRPLTIAKAKQSKIAVLNPSQLRSVQTAFASASCLNASFLDQNLHYTTSNRYPGIDLAKAKSIFNIITSLNDDYLKEVIVERLTYLFQNLPDSPPSIEALRLYVTIPFLAEFEKLTAQDDTNIHSLLFAYAQSINKLKKEAAGRVLDYWFAWTGVEFFRKLITAYKNIVINILNQRDMIVSDSELLRRQNFLKSSMIFLQKLHKINLEFREIVPYDMFYIPDLIDKVDVKKDYFEWLRRKTLKSDSTVIFCDYPFVFDARAKTLLLQTDAELQMQFALNEAVHQNITSLFSSSVEPVNPLLTLFVRRDHIVQDTLNQLSKQKRDELKKPLKVMFIGEDAYDAGGVKKEFFMLLIREILDLKYGMFTYYDESHQIWFNDQTLEGEEMYILIGELCGLAIYNSIIIDLPFPLALYKKLLKEQPTLQDMYALSPSVAKGLDDLLKYTGDDFESVFDLTFEITRQRYDQNINIELIPGGSNIPVTKDNVKQYVNAYIDYIFNKSVEKPFQAFNIGFHRVCGSKVLELFHPSELMSMVIGNQNYDFEELEKNTEYKGDYNQDHPVIKMFWKVFHSFSLEQKKKFLLYLTGTDRIPILGMKRVKLCIQSTKGGDSYFPVAHTCFNLLDLPMYSSEELMRDRLLVAIEHNAGFTIV
ncbi:unnamed protein product [Brachionus calyciflorus]|uniref:HECT domain-containing protein n=1 Tax=Brachionus calyciflorus TaxID=104777 RepID=A0A813ZJ66_9BILA|nr:unnamed protein product [Brachionus calyciflorus]